MLRRDNRGRLRTTLNGVRVELNHKNELRVYHRYNPGHNCERRTDTIRIGEVDALIDGLARVRNTVDFEQGRW